ncbi:MAG: hypothetical protein EOS42_02570 [Mesorhizobium sp.]|nr:MAG: hypothetical protein EOS42_02570 [Mesorhizobium sp.]TIV32259.1 MAG: hypothetical protein E5V90_03845 [Mesorhizobium sp.]
MDYRRERPTSRRGIVIALLVMAVGFLVATSATVWVNREGGSRGELIAQLGQAQASIEQTHQFVYQLTDQNQLLMSRLGEISSGIAALPTTDDKHKLVILDQIDDANRQVGSIDKQIREFLRGQTLTFGMITSPSFSLIATAEAASQNKARAAPRPQSLLDQLADPAHRLLLVILGALGIGAVFTGLYAFSNVPAKQKFYQTVIINVGTFLAGLGGGAFIAG